MSESPDFERMILAREAYAALPDFWASLESRSYDDIKNLLSSYAAVGPEYSKTLKRLDGLEKAGKKPTDLDGWPMGSLESELRYAVNAGRGRLDPMSFTGSIIPPDYRKSEFEWDMLSEKWILRPLDELGGFLNITGRPRMGKTNLAMLVGRLWLQAHPQGLIFTNIPLERPIDRVRQVSGMRGQLFAMADAIEINVPWFWILDEGGLVWPRELPLKSASVGLAHLARVVPKLGGRLAYIDQVAIPSVLELFAGGTIIATGHNSANGFCILDYGSGRHTVRTVPKNEDYRSGSTGYFTVDVNMDDIFQALRDEGKTAQEERIRMALST